MSHACLLLTLSCDTMHLMMHCLNLSDLLSCSQTCKSIQQDAGARTVWNQQSKRLSKPVTLVPLDPEEGLKSIRISRFFASMSFSVRVQLLDFDDSRMVLRRLLHTLLTIPHVTDLHVRQGMAWHFLADEWVRLLSHPCTAHLESLSLEGSAMNSLQTIIPLLGKHQPNLTRFAVHTYLPDSKLPSDPNAMSDLRRLKHLEYIDHSNSLLSRKALQSIVACPSLQHLAVSQSMVQGTNLAWLFSQGNLQSLRTLQIVHAPPNVIIKPPTRVEPIAAFASSILGQEETTPFSLLTCLESIQCDDVDHDFSTGLLSLIGSDHSLGFFTTGRSTNDELPKTRKPLRVVFHLRAVEREPGKLAGFHQEVARILTKTPEDIELRMLVDEPWPATQYRCQYWKQEFKEKIEYEFSGEK